MIRLFKRRSPQHRRPYHRAEPDVITPEDRVVARAYGLTDQEWVHDLSRLDRRDHRDRFYASIGF